MFGIEWFGAAGCHILSASNRSPIVINDFAHISTVLSMVLGLGVTRLLLGAVTVMRIRRYSTFDWVAPVWAAVLFVIQLQFWWAITQLPSVRGTFTFPQFTFLVLLTLMLFLAAALILPNRSEDEKDGLRVYFEKDGRYALLALASFLLLASIANVFFFEESLLSVWAISDVPMIVLPILVFFSGRRWYTALTVTYLPLTAWDIWIS